MHISASAATFTFTLLSAYALSISNAEAIATPDSTNPMEVVKTTTLISSFALANGQEAQSLNAQFGNLTADDTCTGKRIHDHPLLLLC